LGRAAAQARLRKEKQSFVYGQSGPPILEDEGPTGESTGSTAKKYVETCAWDHRISRKTGRVDGLYGDKEPGGDRRKGPGRENHK